MVEKWSRWIIDRIEVTDERVSNLKPVYNHS
jgi:hypothetical protein